MKTMMMVSSCLCHGTASDFVDSSRSCLIQHLILHPVHPVNVIDRTFTKDHRSHAVVVAVAGGSGSGSRGSSGLNNSNFPAS
jgi:hypothetical protein